MSQPPPFPYQDDASLVDEMVAYRFLDNSPNFIVGEGEERRPSSNVWSAVSAETATDLGYARPATSVYFHHVLEALGESPEELAAKIKAPDCGIVSITVDLVRSVTRNGGVGILLDGAGHPAHGIVFRKNDNSAALTSKQKAGLMSIATIVRLP